MSKKSFEDTLLDELDRLNDESGDESGEQETKSSSGDSEVDTDVSDTNPGDTPTKETENESGSNSDDSEESIVDKFISGDKDGVQDIVRKHFIDTVSKVVNGEETED